MSRFTFLISSLIGGGAEGVCVNLANGLATVGHDVDLVVLKHHKDDPRIQLSEKVTLTVLGVNHARWSILPLIRFLLLNKPKSVLIFNYELPLVVLAIRAFFNFKLKVVVRNINTFSGFQKERGGFFIDFVFKPALNRFYSKADFFVNQCYGMREDLISTFPELEAKSIVIYNPIDPSILEYSENLDFNLLRKEDYILCVGRLVNQKSFDTAIMVFARLVNDYPDLRLKIVGSGELLGQLKSLVTKLDLVSRVDFLGYKQDVTLFYAKARLTLLTSLYEGFPNVLLESICIGTPVVAFDCKSGPNEIILDGINGHLVRNRSLEDLEAKLRKTLTRSWSPETVRATARPYYLNEVLKHYELLLCSADA